MSVLTVKETFLQDARNYVIHRHVGRCRYQDMGCEVLYNHQLRVRKAPRATKESP